MMNGNTELDSGFVSGLEDQLVRELRRRQRFGEPERQGGFKRRAGMAVLLILCMATGVAGARTAEHLEDVREAEFLAQQAETEVDLLAARAEASRELAAQMADRVEAGLVSERELAEVKRRVALLAHELERARLNLEETRLALRAPSDELFADTADERDFVAERLELERKMVLEHQAGMMAQRERVEQLVAEGLVHGSEKARVEAELAMTRQAVQEVQRRIELRQAYLEGELTAREVSVREAVEAAELRLQGAQLEAEMAAREAAEMARLRAEDLVADAEARAAELREEAARAQERMARLELQHLQQETTESAPEAEVLPE